VGWLLTYPMFLSERNQLRSRWEAVIQSLGSIPAYPVRAESIPPALPMLGGSDCLDEFLRDFNEFYGRWQLRRLVTWDLPEPLGANLSGYEVPNNFPPTVSRLTLEVPSTLRLPAHYPIRARLEEIQRAQNPEHLQPWLDVQDQQGENGLRHRRFGTLFYLAYYRDIVLASRYHDRFPGNVEKLDQAFAHVLALSTDSIKRGRLTITTRQGVRAGSALPAQVQVQLR
jgi:hypothetical protein